MLFEDSKNTEWEMLAHLDFHPIAPSKKQLIERNPNPQGLIIAVIPSRTFLVQ